jgi:hypothetical protein
MENGEWILQQHFYTTRSIFHKSGASVGLNVTFILAQHLKNPWNLIISEADDKKKRKMAQRECLSFRESLLTLLG